MKRYFVCFAFLMFCTPITADYSLHPSAEAFVERMVNEHGFKAEEINSALRLAKQKESILKAISRPAEKTLTWARYSKIFLTDSRVEQGREFVRTYSEHLDRASKEFGVPKEIITAIIGVETKYGRNKGSFRVLDALTTLGFDYPPRSKFFTKELEQMFLLAREQGFDVVDLKGSYAGAMGYGQFISSSYRHYAVDFDGDGVVDILNNPVDAIGSVANYFKKHHWREGEPVVAQYSLDALPYQELLTDGLKPKLKMQALRDIGFSKEVPVEDDAQVKVLDLQGDEGLETWLAWHNFYVITRYNHSRLYAMAVYQLAQRIGQG